MTFFSGSWRFQYHWWFLCFPKIFASIEIWESFHGFKEVGFDVVLKVQRPLEDLNCTRYLHITYQSVDTGRYLPYKFVCLHVLSYYNFSHCYPNIVRLRTVVLSVGTIPVTVPTYLSFYFLPRTKTYLATYHFLCLDKMTPLGPGNSRQLCHFFNYVCKSWDNVLLW